MRRLAVSEQALAQLLFVAGVAIILAIGVRAVFERIKLPAQVGYLLLGLGLRVADEQWQVLFDESRLGMDFLAELGVVALLFHVGLRSNPRALAEQLPRASVVWVCDVVVSAGLGFASARWLLELELLPSLFVAAALSATSVGISLLSWEQAGALRSRAGEFLLDLSELDDLSAVLLMVLLVSAVPALAGDDSSQFSDAVKDAGLAVFWLAAIGLAAYLFARHLELRITTTVRKWDGVSAMLVVVLGFGLVIAGLAGLAGFSAAVGALFAGLAFSRDPQAVRMDAQFAIVYDLFTPFFFLAIGFAIEPSALGSAMGIGGVLVVAAVVGKLLGAGLPSWRLFGGGGALLIGASMVPRAEIAMVVIRRAKESALVSESVYAGMVTVSAVTCLLSPVAVRYILARFPQQVPPEEEGGAGES